MSRLYSNRDRPFDLITNERDLDQERGTKLAAAQKLAFFPPSLQPPSETTMDSVVPLDRQSGLSAYAAAEAPRDAR